MRPWLRVTLALLALVVAVLVLNAIAVSNETKEAELTVDGGELVETSGGTLQVLEEGDPRGTPIVLIHGYTSSLRWWDRLAPLLGEGHRVIRVDLLGHGGSDKPASGYEIDEQAAAIAEALAARDVSAATVVGHSLGATVEAAMALQSPDLVARIVNIDQAPDGSYEELSFAARLAQAPLVGQAARRLVSIAPDSLVRDAHDQEFASGFSYAGGFEDPDQVVEDLRAMTYTSYVESDDEEDSYTGDVPLDERLSATGLPLLVIFGTEDEIYDADSALEPYRDIEGARIELIEGVGHVPQVEAPEETAELILEFAEADSGEPQGASKPKPKRKKQKNINR